MKRIITTLILALALLSVLQLKAQVKIGDNPTTINAGSILEVESTDKGVLFPRINLTDLTQWQPLVGTAIAGMTVYNTNTTTGVGFYYWDGARWVKLSVAGASGDQEWVYANDTIKLKRSGTGTFDNNVCYTKDGKFRNYDTSTFEQFNYDLNQWTTYETKDNVAKNYILGKSQKLNGLTFPTNAQYRQKYLSSNIFVGNEAPNTGLDYHLVANSNSIISEKDNTANYSGMTGLYGGATFQSGGNVANLIGTSTGSRILKGTCTGPSSYVMSCRATAQSHTPGNVDNLIGYGSFTSLGSQAGNVGRVRDFNGTIYYLHNNTSVVNSSYNIEIGQNLYSNASPTITNAAGLYYRAFSGIGGGTAPTITNNYGILLENIVLGKHNYAIYTNAGKTSLGDTLQVRNINATTSADATDKVVVADANGVLKTKDANVKNIRTLALGVIADNDYTVLATGSISLPAPATTNTGRIYNIINDTNGSVTINGTFRINGSNSTNCVLNTTPGERTVVVQSTGSDWVVIANY